MHYLYDGVNSLKTMLLTMFNALLKKNTEHENIKVITRQEENTI